jgi:hypothetical protein
MMGQKFGPRWTHKWWATLRIFCTRTIWVPSLNHDFLHENTWHQLSQSQRLFRMLGRIKVHHPSCIIEFSQFRFQDIHRFSRLSSGFEAHERSRLKVGAIWCHSNDLLRHCKWWVFDLLRHCKRWFLYVFMGGTIPEIPVLSLSTYGKSPVSKVNHLWELPY